MILVAVRVVLGTSQGDICCSLEQQNSESKPRYSGLFYVFARMTLDTNRFLCTPFRDPRQSFRLEGAGGIVLPVVHTVVAVVAKSGRYIISRSRYSIPDTILGNSMFLRHPTSTVLHGSLCMGHVENIDIAIHQAVGVFPGAYRHRTILNINYLPDTDNELRKSSSIDMNSYRPPCICCYTDCDG